MKLSRSSRLALGGVLALGLLALFFRGVEWPSLLAALRTARPTFLAGSVLATLVTYAFRAWRWGYLLQPLAQVPFTRLFRVTVIGFMSGLLVPRAGEVLRPYLVARRHGIRTSAAFASIILERLLDLIAVLVLFGLYLYVLPFPAAQTRGPLLGFLKAGGAAAGGLALVMLTTLVAFHLRAEQAMNLAEKLLSHLPARLAGPAGQALRSFVDGLAVLNAGGGHLAAMLGQSFLVWLAIALSIHLADRAFGLDLPFHSSFLVIGFLTVGVAVPTPGGVGGFHETYLLALTQAYGVSHDLAAAIGLSAHAIMNLPILFLGLVFLKSEGLTLGNVAEMTEKEEKT